MTFEEQIEDVTRALTDLEQAQESAFSQSRKIIRKTKTAIHLIHEDRRDAELIDSISGDIAAALEKKREKLDVSFVLDTLDYLVRGGRCSSLAALSANFLHLKPCIEVKDGKMGVGRKYRGKLEKCYVQYIEDRLKGRDDIDCHRIFITDSGIDEATWQELERVVRACQPFEEVYHTQAGCTVSNHCGPGCMGILYYHK